MKFNNKDADDYQHDRSMKQFNEEFNDTKEQVYKKNRQHGSIMKTVIIIAVAAAVVIIGIIFLATKDSVNKSIEKSAVSKDREAISSIIYGYLEDGSYKELSDYSDSINALDNEAFEEEYSVLMGARYYKWSCGFMNMNKDNSNLEESDVSYLSQYLQEFYYYTQMSAYKDNKATQTEKNQGYLDKMREDMGELLKKYYHLTDDDLSKITTFSQAGINKCLTERSITGESR